MKHNLSKLIFLPVIHLIFGQIIPLSFIYLDLTELGLAITTENALDIYRSQYIYPFSSIISPIVLGLVYLLLATTKQQKIFYQNILNQMDENIIVFNSNQIAIYQNIAMKKSPARNKTADLLPQKHRQDIFEWSFTENEITTYYLVNFKHDPLNSTFILIMKDISELRKKEEFIKMQEITLSRSSKLASLGEIAAGIAHEINNPLAVIIGTVEMIEGWLVGPQEDTRKGLEKISKMGKRISNIIKLMKNLSREDQNNQFDVIDMASFMDDFICLANISIKKFCIDLKLDVASFKGAYINGNSTQLSQVMINLINNAVQAIEADDDKWIDISLLYDPDYLILRISNSGVKISGKIVEKIFQPFYTTKDPGKGTGLGLSISKSIVESHHGSLELDEKSQNTTFVIKLPRAAIAEAA